MLQNNVIDDKNRKNIPKIHANEERKTVEASNKISHSARRKIPTAKFALKPTNRMDDPSPAKLARVLIEKSTCAD
jgi:hypothetical protein